MICHDILLKHTTAQEHEDILHIKPDVFHRVRIPTRLTTNIISPPEAFAKPQAFVTCNRKHQFVSHHQALKC